MGVPTVHVGLGGALRFRPRHRLSANISINPTLPYQPATDCCAFASRLFIYGLIARMPGSEATTATRSVDDIANLSDAQLAKFMQDHRLHNGDFDLPVDGWDKLSGHDRNQLADRLK